MFRVLLVILNAVKNLRSFATAQDDTLSYPNGDIT